MHSGHTVSDLIIYNTRRRRLAGRNLLSRQARRASPWFLLLACSRSAAAAALARFLAAPVTTFSATRLKHSFASFLSGKDATKPRSLQCLQRGVGELLTARSNLNAAGELAVRAGVRLFRFRRKQPTDNMRRECITSSGEHEAATGSGESVVWGRHEKKILSKGLPRTRVGRKTRHVHESTLDLALGRFTR